MNNGALMAVALRMKHQLFALSLVLVCASVGCKTHSPSQYVSPQVTGRVVDAETKQPLAEVKVQRVKPGQAHRPDPTLKGGQIMQDAPVVVVTDAEGRFVVDSESTLVLFRKINWHSVSLSFQREGYGQLTTNFTPANATELPNGEPEVKAGDILMHRLE